MESIQSLFIGLLESEVPDLFNLEGPDPTKQFLRVIGLTQELYREILGFGVLDTSNFLLIRLRDFMMKEAWHKRELRLSAGAL